MQFKNQVLCYTCKRSFQIHLWNEALITTILERRLKQQQNFEEEVAQESEKTKVGEIKNPPSRCLPLRKV